MWGGLRRVARGRLLLAQAGPAPAPPTTAPAASQPTPRPRQKARRRAVRAVRTGGKQKAVMVISNKDSAKLLADPKAAGLARQGRVLVVVDAAAGGMEGRRPRRPGPTDLAGAPR